MGRRRSTVDDLLAIATSLPWWVSLLVGAVMYFVLHHYAVMPTPQIRAGAQVLPQNVLGTTLTKTICTLLQYVVPGIFAFGALLSVMNRRRGRRSFESVKNRGAASALLDMSWRDFERTVAEAFRRRGFSVAENQSAGPDGGIDLVLKKGNETFLVQCKRWKATMVGVDIVRELFGVMAAKGAVGAFVVTAGKFSPDAIAFSEGRNIELIDGPKLMSMIEGVPKIQVAPQAAQISCPKCGGPMLRKTARRGSNAGNDFYGCSRHPACKGTRPISAS